MVSSLMRSAGRNPRLVSAARLRPIPWPRPVRGDASIGPARRHRAGDAGGQNTTSGLRIGSGQNGISEFWTGDIAEVICYDPALSTTNRDLVEGYLRDKYGL
jgi:hypothetical protein